MRKRIDLTGQKFGRLTVIEYSHSEKTNEKIRLFWKCKCDCSAEKTVPSSNLRGGHTKSCGCLQKEIRNRTTHGMTETPLYVIWAGIKQRCYNQNTNRYKYYGEKGVKMCDEWFDFKNFYDWCTSNNWKKGMPICRKGDVGNYSPENCYITTTKQNNRDNKTNKLNMWKARVIRVMYKNHGWSNVRQSEFWGVNSRTISAIICNKIWIN